MGAAREKPWLAGIGGVHRNEKGYGLFMFSMHVVFKDTNEAEVPPILEAIHIYLHGFHDFLIIQSDSSNSISWMMPMES